jgi:hypothetical protein
MRKYKLLILVIVVSFSFFILLKDEENIKMNADSILDCAKEYELPQIAFFIDEGIKLYSQDCAYDCYQFKLSSKNFDKLTSYLKRKGFTQWRNLSIRYGPVDSSYHAWLVSTKSVTPGSLIIAFTPKKDKMYLVRFFH